MGVEKQLKPWFVKKSTIASLYTQMLNLFFTIQMLNLFFTISCIWYQIVNLYKRSICIGHIVILQLEWLQCVGLFVVLHKNMLYEWLCVPVDFQTLLHFITRNTRMGWWRSVGWLCIRSTPSTQWRGSRPSTHGPLSSTSARQPCQDSAITSVYR